MVRMAAVAHSGAGSSCGWHRRAGLGVVGVQSTVAVAATGQQEQLAPANSRALARPPAAAAVTLGVLWC
jgi:hypothetical protein